MITITNKLSLDVSYTGTDFTRRYTMSGLSAGQLPNIENTVDAINTSLSGGTAGGLSSTFISDDFDSTQGIGYMKKIEKAVITSTEEIPIEF